MQCKNDNTNTNSNDLDKKGKKKPAAEFIMPTKENYTMLLSVNYPIKQLKEIAIHHKIKVNSSLVGKPNGKRSLKTSQLTQFYSIKKFATKPQV